MARRIKLNGWILIFIVMILLISGIVNLVRAPMKVNSQEEIQEEKVISKYPKINLKTINRQTDDYTYSINHPETDSDKINQSIDKWINGQKEAFLREVESNKDVLIDGAPAHLNIQMETNRITEDFYSLVFQTYMANGGANGQNSVKIFNIDIKNDRFLKIDEVLELNDRNLADVKDIVWEELQKNKEIKPYVIAEEFDQLMEHPGEWEWSIDRKSFTLYMDEYEIAAGAAGAFEIEIPVERMYIFLQKEVDSFLKMPKKQKLEKEKIIQQEQMKLDPNGKYIALTFDDGPNPEVTPRILKTLKKHDAKATFFMLGSQADYYPALARKVAESGHEIGNHSKSHPDLSKMGFAKIKEELDDSRKKIEGATGIQTNLIRPPYGAYNEHLKTYAEMNGDAIILWSVDSLDWKSRNAVSVNRIIENKSAPGGIILMHDIHPSTADALPKLLTTLEAEGYQFVTVSQLLHWKEESGIGPHFGDFK